MATKVLESKPLAMSEQLYSNRRETTCCPCRGKTESPESRSAVFNDSMLKDEHGSGDKEGCSVKQYETKGQECVRMTTSETCETDSHEMDETARLEAMLTGRTGKLYDRLEEEQALLDAYRRSDQELLLVCGPSGTGKTALAYTLKQHVENDGGLFVSGKFDQLQRPEPYTPFVTAFTEFVHLQLQRGEEDTALIKAKILEAAGSDISILTDMIPALEQIFGTRKDPSTARGSDPQNRLKLVLRQFVRAICSPRRPLVFFLDDLQWADASSLDLFNALVLVDRDDPGFMLLGACRSNEASPAHQLSAVLRELEDDGLVVTELSVSNLKCKAVHEMLVDVLGRSPAETEPLLDTVCRCTNCNAFFVLFFLRSVYEEGLLQMNQDRKMWVWNEDLIMERFDCHDVLQFVRNVIAALPEEVQDVLKVASCIGTDFDEYLLHDIMPFDIAPALAAAEEKGLILIENSSSGGYRFSHDNVQQAAYSLIPAAERDMFHLSLGKSLCESLKTDDLVLHIFLVVNQFRIGAELVNDTGERYRMALLCLSAGEKATRVSAFATAAEYLNLGISLLGHRHWRDEYDLSLALYNTAAEVEYCNARFDRVSSLVEEVIANAWSFQDQLRAYTTKVYTLGTLNRPQEAIATGLMVLSKLGQTFPRNVTTFRFMMEFIKTRRMLGGKSMDEIMELPLMKRPDQLAAMRMMNILYLHAFTCRPELAPMLSFRIVQMSLQHGLSGMSSPGFSSYGMFLSGVFRKFDVAFCFGQLSLRMMDRFPGKEWLPRTYITVYGMINTWKDPFRESLESLRLAHRVGLASGDIEVSLFAEVLSSKVSPDSHDCTFAV